MNPDDENWAGPDYTTPYTEQEEEAEDANPLLP